MELAFDLGFGRCKHYVLSGISLRNRRTGHIQTDLCSRLLHKFLVRICLGEGPHVLEERRDQEIHVVIDLCASIVAQEHNKSIHVRSF